jgi:hypothetical protein
VRRRLFVAGAALAVLSGCAYYAPYPGAPASFDRSFGAAAAAMRDQGLTVGVEDRANGQIVGSVGGGGTVTANVRTQADGSVRVQFDARDVRDAALIQRISSAYDARMGR